ncbi:hypothetical protein U7128_000060 [Bacillus phage KKP_4050]
MLLRDNSIPRYERQMDNVDHLILNTIREKKGVNISMKELNLILEALYEWRVLD